MSAALPHGPTPNRISSGTPFDEWNPCETKPRRTPRSLSTSMTPQRSWSPAPCNPQSIESTCSKRSVSGCCLCRTREMSAFNSAASRAKTDSRSRRTSCGDVALDGDEAVDRPVVVEHRRDAGLDPVEVVVRPFLDRGNAEATIQDASLPLATAEDRRPQVLEELLRHQTAGQDARRESVDVERFVAGQLGERPVHERDVALRVRQEDGLRDGHDRRVQPALVERCVSECGAVFGRVVHLRNIDSRRRPR